MFFEKKTLPFFKQVVQNHFEDTSVGYWPLFSGGGNTLDTFLSFTVIGDEEKLVSLLF